MLHPRGLHLLLLACLLAGAALPAPAEESSGDQAIEDSFGRAAPDGEDFTPRPKRVFTGKPRIEDYTDYGSFLVDIMEYRRQREEATRDGVTTPAPATAVSTTAAGSNADPAVYRINGPESLEEALVRAKTLPHPVYTESERYGRTTADSFPIQPLAGEDMSAKEVAGQLADLESLDPETYRELDEIEENVAVEQGRKPTNDKKTREQQADSDASAHYRPTYEKENRLVSDSDGNTYRIPILIKNEVDYTVIRRADFSAEIIKR